MLLQTIDELACSVALLRTDRCAGKSYSFDRTCSRFGGSVFFFRDLIFNLLSYTVVYYHIHTSVGNVQGHKWQRLTHSSGWKDWFCFAISARVHSAFSPIYRLHIALVCFHACKVHFNHSIFWWTVAFLAADGLLLLWNVMTRAFIAIAESFSLFHSHTQWRQIFFWATADVLGYSPRVLVQTFSSQTVLASYAQWNYCDKTIRHSRVLFCQDLRNVGLARNRLNAVVVFRFRAFAKPFCRPS